MTPDEFRAARKSLGLTQDELAEQLVTSLRTITMIEQGKTPKARLYALALRGLMAEMSTRS